MEKYLKLSRSLSEKSNSQPMCLWYCTLAASSSVKCGFLDGNSIKCCHVLLLDNAEGLKKVRMKIWGHTRAMMIVNNCEINANFMQMREKIPKNNEICMLVQRNFKKKFILISIESDYTQLYTNG